MLADCLPKPTARTGLGAFLRPPGAGGRSPESREPSSARRSAAEGRVLALPPTSGGPCALPLLCVNKSCLRFSLLDSQSDRLLQLLLCAHAKRNKNCLHSKAAVAPPPGTRSCCGRASPALPRLPQTPARTSGAGRAHSRRRSATGCPASLRPTFSRFEAP